MWEITESGLLGGPPAADGLNPFDYLKDSLARLPAAKITEINLQFSIAPPGY